jgi:hypothetical protein
LLSFIDGADKCHTLPALYEKTNKIIANTHQKNSGSKTVDDVSHEVHGSFDGLGLRRLRRSLDGPLLRLLVLRRGSVSSLNAIIITRAVAPLTGATLTPGSTISSRGAALIARAAVAPRAPGAAVARRRTTGATGTPWTIMESRISPGRPVVGARWGSEIGSAGWAAAVRTGRGSLEGRPDGTVVVAERRRWRLEGSLLAVGVEGELLGRSPVLPLRRPLLRPESAPVLTPRRTEILGRRLVGRAVEVGWGLVGVEVWRQRSVRGAVEERWRPVVLRWGTVERRPGVEVLRLAHVHQ